MISFITFLTLDNQVYEATTKSSPSDISIPSNPYDNKSSYFDRDKFEWILNTNEIINDQKAVMNKDTKNAIINGFTYTIMGIEYTFSYTLEDQQNVSNIVNTILINKSIGITNYPISYTCKKDDKPFQLIITPDKFIEIYMYAVKNKIELLRNNDIDKYNLSN